jgi:hypothetical protein
MNLRCGNAAIGAVVCALMAAVSWCQPNPWPAVPVADPLRFSSLPLEGAQAVAPPRGEWRVADALSYFNVWQLTWHTGTIHNGFGLLGQPLTDREVKILEQNFPRDQFYHIDLEGTRNDLYVSRGFAGGLAATVCVPWIDIGTPHWDAIAERFHDNLGLGNMRRDWFPRGQSTVVVRGRHGTIERLSGLAGSGLADMSVSVTGPLGRWLGAEHRWAVAVEAPTGEKETLRGSGGWDAGVRWFGTWGTGPRQVRVALAYTWLDSAGSWLGARRDNMWAALAEGHAPLGRRLTVRASARFDSSPLASFTDSDIGKVSFYWTVGVLAPRAGNSWVAFDLGENYPGTAEAPDFSFHLQVGVRIPGAR